MAAGWTLSGPGTGRSSVMAPSADQDPEYQAVVTTLAEKERRATEEQARQREIINQSLQPGLDALADNAKQARNTTLSNMEGRGVLRSGETGTRLTGVEQQRLGGETTLRTGIAGHLSDLDAGTQAALADIAAQRTTAFAGAQQRQTQRQAELDAQQAAADQQAAQAEADRKFQQEQLDRQLAEMQREFDLQNAAVAGGGGGGGGGRGGGGGGGGGQAILDPAAGAGTDPNGGVPWQGVPYPLASVIETMLGRQPDAPRPGALSKPKPR